MRETVQVPYVKAAAMDSAPLKRLFAPFVAHPLFQMRLKIILVRIVFEPHPIFRLLMHPTDMKGPSLKLFTGSNMAEKPLWPIQWGHISQTSQKCDSSPKNPMSLCPFRFTPKDLGRGGSTRVFCWQRRWP